MAIVIKVLMEEVIRVKSQSPHNYTNEQENNEVDLPGFDNGLHYKHEDLAPILEFLFVETEITLSRCLSVGTRRRFCPRESRKQLQ